MADKPLRGNETDIANALGTSGVSPPFRKRVVLSWTEKAEPRESVVVQRTRVGSSPDVDLQVQGSGVSRLHCEIDVQGDSAWVRDLGSKNGTRVNGLRVQSASLPHGSRLRLGGVDIAISYASTDEAPAPYPHAQFGGLIGGSAEMRELYAALARVSGTDASVLISGESGTGKELVARSIHGASPRKDGPFVVVDCGALPENLLDAELFGHAKGAFTGADRAREGAFEAATGGTIFLDEIGELPLSVQSRLLRVLEARTVRRLGETAHRPIDVRFVSATHRDLPRMANEGTFREDLYFRLSVIPVRVPSLRERVEDVGGLLASFLGGKRVATDVLHRLERHAWPGNVRELRNFAERVRVLGEEQALRLFQAADDGGVPAGAAPGSAPAPRLAPRVAPGADTAPKSPLTTFDERLFDATYREFTEGWSTHGERAYIERLLEKHDRNVTAAARTADIGRTYLHRIIKRLFG